VLLLGLARACGALDGAAAIDGYWPMVRAAAEFLVCNGPVTAEDRWEEDGGYSPFTLAAEIAALLTAAGMAEEAGEPEPGRYFRETADTWDAHIESWCYATGTDLADSVGVEGYYVRIGPPDESGAATPLEGWVPIKNRPPGEDSAPARSVVSPDALALVRFGLRDPDDPRVTDTVAVVDAVLRHDFDYGPGWHRYNDDGYGEHADGSPFDGHGVGRVWPLLTGERAHFELAAGRIDTARGLAATMRAMAGRGRLLPEQVWDGPDVPGAELRSGKPSGSAMPLVWAHAEYLKLLRSIADRAVFDLPLAVRQRRIDPRAGHRRFWRRNHKIQSMEPGGSLRIEVPTPSVIHWTAGGGADAAAVPTRDTGTGMHIADLETELLPAGAKLSLRMEEADRGESDDYTISIEEASP
jgi:glucoamylase